MDDKTLSTAEIVEKFLQAETESCCLSRNIEGYSYWPAARFGVFYNYILKRLYGTGDSHPDGAIDQRAGFISKCKKALASIWNIYGIARMSRRFLDRRKYDILFALEPRMMKIDGRGYAPIMLDFFAERISVPYAVMQYSSGKQFVCLPKRYVTFRPRASCIRKMCCKKFVRSRRIQNAILAELTHTLSYFEQKFSMQFDIVKLQRTVSGQMIGYMTLFPAFKAFLSRHRVKCVVTSCHYHPYNLVLCKAAHSLRLKVVELQHGYVGDDHIAYNLPTVSPDYPRPDFVLAWGRIWEKGFRNYAICGVKSTGYPFADYARLTYLRQATDKMEVLFISQPNVGDVLSKLAIKVAAQLDSHGSFRVRYKPHPSETMSWSINYPWLQGSAVEVVDNTQTNIYSELSRSSVVVGVGSTAIIEAVLFGVKGLVVADLPTADIMKTFVDAGILQYIHLNEDIVAKITEISSVKIMANDSRCNDLFQTGAASAIADFLSQTASLDDLRGEGDDNDCENF